MVVELSKWLYLFICILPHDSVRLAFSSSVAGQENETLADPG
jgi:hypothetical protein